MCLCMNLLLRMVRMDVDWNLKKKKRPSSIAVPAKISQKLLLLLLPDEISLKSPWQLYKSILCMSKSTNRWREHRIGGSLYVFWETSHLPLP